MKQKVDIIVANPAGNITIFVKTPFERRMYQKVASQLLAMEEYKGEQVSFILDAPECGRAEGKMEMCGLEFCGNGSRSFGLITAKKLGIKGHGKTFVDVSGCDEILTVEVDTDTNYTKVKMPAPVEIKTLDLSNIIGEREVKAIDFGGILHIILTDQKADQETFEQIKEYVNKKLDPPALGVMFYDLKAKTLTPVVYVKDVDTTYFEGSCGSGTTACAVAFSIGKPDGVYTYTFPQPAGVIDSTVEIADGNIKSVYIEGPVELSDVITVEIDV